MSIRRHKSGCYKIDIPVWEYTFHIAFSNESVEALTRGNVEKKDYFAAVIEFKDDPPIMVLCDTSHNSIAHECHHLLCALLRKKGSFVSLENQEPTAYLAGYIAEQVYKCREMYDLRIISREDKGE